MDLIDEISQILHFKYEFRLVPNNAYGSYNKETKKWDGLVKELLDHVSQYRNIYTVPPVIFFYKHSVEL